MEASPRVNGSQLPKYIGQTVSIVGRTKGVTRGFIINIINCTVAWNNEWFEVISVRIK